MSDAPPVRERNPPPGREVLNAGLKVGLGSIANLLGSVVAGKLLAIYLGAAGLGLFGLLRQLLQNLTLAGSFNGQVALVQGIASRPEKNEQVRFSGSVLGFQILIASFLAFLLLVSAPWLGPRLIPHPNAVDLLRWLSLGMLVVVAQSYVTGLLNGYGLITDLVLAQALGPLGLLVLVFPMIWLIREGHPSGFVLMLAGPGIGVALVAAGAVKRRGFAPRLKNLRFRFSDLHDFFGMSAVLLATGLISTGSQFLQSWMIADRMGFAQAGLFWTAWTISMSYVTLLLGSLGTYYMPSLSRLNEPDDRRSLIRTYLRLALLAMPLLVSAVIIFKPWMIQAMFTTALFPALKVMRWMLIGDLFKGISWVLSFPMLAFNEMKWFFWTETCFSLGLLCTSWIWIASGGDVEGLGAFFMMLYVLYLSVMILYIRIRHGFSIRSSEVVAFLSGLGLVLLLSAYTWQDEGVRPSAIVSFALLGGGFCLFTPAARSYLLQLWRGEQTD